MMPRQRIRHSRETCEIPENFSQRLRRFKRESGVSWSEIARRLGTYRHTVWRWAEGRTQPSYQHRRGQATSIAGAVRAGRQHGPLPPARQGYRAPRRPPRPPRERRVEVQALVDAKAGFAQAGEALFQLPYSSSVQFIRSVQLVTSIGLLAGKETASTGQILLHLTNRNK